MVMVHNRRSPPDRIWVTSCYKKELIELGITDIISEHNWGNWIFSIPRKDYYEKIKKED